jgi:hypothetical protein
MRGIRIVAFTVTALLACLVAAHIIGIENLGNDSAPQSENSEDLGRAGRPPEVPPPPPLPVQPAKKPTAPAKVEETEPLAETITPALENTSPLENALEAVEKAVVFTGDVEVVSPAPLSPTAFTAHKGVQTASVPELKAGVPR